ncbi:cuticle protein 16.5 [Manduca sexta]|uniref:Uncharacterized protein n=1 Tax=Manduca sexta TaxID=7130 RepID=A0A921YNC9_MANSE|nr:cuticle protein 16.5 [Manduca sexta]KAG6442254.1 hypothetical protein O3G_MSEX002186 [Manduca sexta]KAG6442255.1 hypothetical protein O3G_MSEX002186 [Manduca sexta]
MKTLVVLFVFAAVAHASILPLAQPAHHPAVVVDARGRPLDTAEVIEARALHLQAKALEAHHAPVVAAVAVPSVVAAPAAVSHQSRVDVHSSPAIVSHAVAAPVIAHAAPVLIHAAAPVLAHSALAHVGHGHYLKKRSLSHVAYSVPAIAPAAVSHQSRVDVISSPAVVSHVVAAPVVAHAVAAPVVAHAIAPAAVSHQSRVDVRVSPAVVAHAPVAVSHAVVAGPVYGVHALSHGHLLKKRSLAAVVAPVVHAVPAAVSHQSRVDVISEPAVVAHAAPVAVAHVVPAVVAAPAAVSHQSRVDVVSAAHVAPLAHSAVWTAPVAHLSHAGLVKAALW